MTIFSKIIFFTYIFFVQIDLYILPKAYIMHKTFSQTPDFPNKLFLNLTFYENPSIICIEKEYFFAIFCTLLQNYMKG